MYDFSTEVKEKVERFGYVNNDGALKVKLLDDESAENPFKNDQKHPDATSVKWTTNNEYFLVGTATGTVYIYTFMENHQLGKPDPQEVPVFEGKKVIGMIYDEPTLIAISDQGDLAFKNVAQKCPDDESLNTIFLETEDNMEIIEQISDS